MRLMKNRYLFLLVLSVLLGTAAPVRAGMVLTQTGIDAARGSHRVARPRAHDRAPSGQTDPG